jgi:hypothetical protein
MSMKRGEKPYTLLAGDACRSGDEAERSIAQVLEQSVAAAEPAGDEEIQISIEIVIAERRAKSIGSARVGDAGGKRHVGERAIAVVLVESMFARGRRTLRWSETGDVNVLPSVVVVVADRSANSQMRLRDAPFVWRDS